MKMESLDAAKTLVDREHALHSGTPGAPSSTSGAAGPGVGGGGGGRYKRASAIDQQSSEKKNRDGRAKNVEREGLSGRDGWARRVKGSLFVCV